MGRRHHIAVTLAIAVALISFNPVPAQAWNRPDNPRPVDASGGQLSWAHRPSFYDFSDIFGSFRASHGYAVVECVIGKNLRLDECIIIQEDPPGKRIGKAVSKFAEQYQAMSKDSLGASPVGRRVRFGMGVAGEKEM